MGQAEPAPFIIRDAGPGDLDAVDALEAASFPADRFARRNLARLLRVPTASALIAERAAAERKPSGYVLLLFRKGAKAARLYSLAVAPGARGQGVAAALVEAAARKAQEKGCARLRLEVRDSNMAARRLYESAGFAAISMLPDYYEDGESAVKMEKRLDAKGWRTR